MRHLSKHCAMKYQDKMQCDTRQDVYPEKAAADRGELLSSDDCNNEEEIRKTCIAKLTPDRWAALGIF